MAALVSIQSDLRGSTTIEAYAKWLAAILNDRPTSGYMGKDAAFERNQSAVLSKIYKIHVRVPGEQPWNSAIRRAERTSDNFLVYTQHIYYPNYFQIIALITPKAHSKAQSLLPKFVEIAEKSFHSLNERQIRQLKVF